MQFARINSGKPESFYVMLLFYNCHLNLTVKRHNQPDFNEKKGISMIINWVATKAQQFLTKQDDELNASFDFALSPEMMDLLYAQNDNCMDAGQQSEADNVIAIRQVELDEYELALT